MAFSVLCLAVVEERLAEDAGFFSREDWLAEYSIGYSDCGGYFHSTLFRESAGNSVSNLLLLVEDEKGYWLIW